MSGPPPKRPEVRQRRNARLQLAIVSAPPERVVVPPLPTDLRTPLPQTIEKWEAYWQSPVARVALESGGLDMAGLHRWILNVDEWHRAMRAFRSKRIVQGSTGQPTLNPLGSYIASREAAIKDAEQQYGMTPMARLKLGIAVGQAQLTAAELNKLMQEESDEPGDADELETEWEASS